LREGDGTNPDVAFPLIDFLNKVGLDISEFVGPGGRLYPNQKTTSINGDRPRDCSDLLAHNFRPFVSDSKAKKGMTEGSLAIL
jgi:hypothetical protein